MKFPCNVLFRSRLLHKNNLVFGKTIFIRSIDKPNKESTNTINSVTQQPYNKFFVIDFEATCANEMQLIKPQVDNYF